MAEHKTVVPGMGPDNDYGQQGGQTAGGYGAGGYGAVPGYQGGPFSPGGDVPFESGYRQQQGDPAMARSGRGTVVPGMNDAQFEKAAPPNDPIRAQSSGFPGGNPSGKPVVGFLYSVSRTKAGEFWPLHVGKNVIGQAPDCDVVLAEGTVSGHHAVIVTRWMNNPVRLVASVSDTQSSNGTMINGNELFLQAEECKNGDVLTVGNNYELFMVLVDVASLGLQPAPNFISVKRSASQGQRPPVPFGPSDGPIPPYGPQQPFVQGTQPFTPTDGTVGLDGQQDQGHGGTVPM